jgi:hypothetical protein
MTSDWRTSSYTGGQGDCVEVAKAKPAVMVRDSKDRDGALITIPAAAWQLFTDTLK